jgi:hypothetical protein
MDGIRIVAEWLHKWEPRIIEDGTEEYFTDDQEYTTEICDTLIAAAKLAEDRDIYGAGSVLIEEWQYLDTYFDWQIFDWVEIERHDAGSIIAEGQS